MLRPQGYLTVIDDQMVERDTLQCGHCNKIVIIKPGTSQTVYLIESLHVDPVTRKSTIVTQEEMGAFCRQCMKAICLECCDHGVCTPLMKRIAQMEGERFA